MPSWTAITLAVISIVGSLSVLAALAVSERLNRLSIRLQRGARDVTPESRSPATCSVTPLAAPDVRPVQGDAVAGDRPSPTA